jgi:hypothetical protein
MAEEKKTDAQAADSTPKKKKINEMSLAELDAKLAEVKEKQGGLTSKYAHQLADRKKALKP